MTALAGWENFYVIVGSAAGALIGLEFVVVTLIADSPTLRVVEGFAAFATPTIVHFGVVLSKADQTCSLSCRCGPPTKEHLQQRRTPRRFACG
jgi:hypothetical protein